MSLRYENPESVSLSSECYATLLAAAFNSWADRGRIGSPEEVYDEMATCADEPARLMGAPLPAA